MSSIWPLPSLSARLFAAWGPAHALPEVTQAPLTQHHLPSWLPARTDCSLASLGGLTVGFINDKNSVFLTLLSEPHFYLLPSALVSFPREYEELQLIHPLLPDNNATLLVHTAMYTGLKTVEQYV